MEDNAYHFRNSNFVHQQYDAQFQVNPINRGKPCSHLLLKLLFISLFLCLLPLFPTEAPELISHTFFAKIWELFHLLIIGIVLSYGLFCRKKSPQISPNSQISQPFMPNILHHSSIFDYEDGNPSGFFEKNPIPAQSSNFPLYTTNPFVVLGTESCKNLDDRPLGLPVRSLRSRVVDSDSYSDEDEDEDEECVSDCESHLSGQSSCNISSGMARSVKDENLEGFMGNSSTVSWKSRSMRVDFMEENGKFESKRLKSQSFRSQTQESCQKNSGFCSWLPESPNIETQNLWRQDNLNIPFSKIPTQVNGSNFMGISSNLEKGNLGSKEPDFCRPLAPSPPMISVSNTGLASSITPSRSRKFNNEIRNLEDGNLGGDKTHLGGDFTSCIKPSRSKRTNSGLSLKNDGQRLEKGNVGIDPLPIPTPRNDFSSSIDEKNNEARSIPTMWDDDCFVILSSENNDMGTLEQENLSHGSTYSSQPASSAGSSSKSPSDGQRSPQNKLEIEDLRKEIESYKPSTPSPPPRVQTRKNQLTPSIDSSSNALGNGFLFNEDDDQESPPTRERQKVLSKTSHSRRFSCGSFFDRDLRRSFKDESKDANKKNNGAKCEWNCLKLDVKPTLSKAALKGKSVRTIRPREIAQERKNDDFEHQQNGERSEMVVIQIGISEKRSNSYSKNGDEKQANATTSIILGLNSKESSRNEKAAAQSDSKEEETDTEEIDKKAAEFIAKFKEQIRLQKITATK